MKNVTNLHVGLALAISFLVATQVRADFLQWDWAVATKKATTDQAAAAKGFSLRAEDVVTDDGTKGVQFTFTNVTPIGDSFGEFGSKLYFFRANEWSHGNGGTLAKMNDGGGSWKVDGVIDDFPIKWRDSFTATFAVDTSGYSSETGQWTFTLPYASNGYGSWTSFKNRRDGVFIGMDFGGSQYYTSSETLRDERTGATPEPATLAVLGLGLAGLGIASRRRRKE